MAAQILILVHYGQEDPFASEAAEEQELSDDLYCPFELPEEEYGEMMFERRFAPYGSASPSASAQAGSTQPSPAAETDGKQTPE